MAKKYELNEKDIDSVIRYLKQIDPQNATPEMAIAFLEEYQAKIHILAHEDPEYLEKIYQKVKRKRLNS